MISFLRKSTVQDKMRIVSLPLYMIAPNPNQPRKYFEPQAMEELKNSIMEYGLIQPVTVRRRSGEYELVAGERRFRAAQMAGLDEIPAVIIEADNDKSLIREQGLTQTELALKVGKSQASVANKIRLLKLPPLVKKLIRDYDLTERHARALLLLNNEEKQLEAVKLICRDNMNVTQAEELVRTMNIPKPKPINDLRITTAKDVKVFKNTVKRAVDLMKKSGIDARIEENSFEWGTEYIIKIKKTDKK